MQAMIFRTRKKGTLHVYIWKHGFDRCMYILKYEIIITLLMYWIKERVVTICRNWRREQDSWPRNLSKTRPNPTKAFCLSGKSTTRIAYHSICHTDSSSFYNLKVMIWSYSFNNKQGGGGSLTKNHYSGIMSLFFRRYM